MSLLKKSRLETELEAFKERWKGNLSADDTVRVLLDRAKNCKEEFKTLSDQGVPA